LELFPSFVRLGGILTKHFSKHDMLACPFTRLSNGPFGESPVDLRIHLPVQGAPTSATAMSA
jgi:hypothetical protein